MKEPRLKVEIPTGSGRQWWESLTHRQKLAAAAVRLETGGSNKSVGEAFGVTPNSIASIRNKWNNQGKPLYEVAWKDPDAQEESLPEPVAGASPTAEPVDDLPVPFEPRMRPARKPRSAQRPTRKTKPKDPGCEWPLASGKACGKPRVPNSRLCEEHRAYALKRV